MSNDLSLIGILITHYHSDHIGGVAALKKMWPDSVVISKDGIFGGLSVSDGEYFRLGRFEFEAIEVPGHVPEHMAYYLAGNLFVGDTLFGGGCGRLTDGSAEQMYSSLQKIVTRYSRWTFVWFAHEYTMSNLRFALSLYPGNSQMSARLHQAQYLLRMGSATVPSTLDLELHTNPFLLCSTAEDFSRIRKLKDNY